MRRMFLGLTLGGDPHTVGIYRAGRIAKMLGIETKVIPPDMSLDMKISIIKELNPMFLGLSYRLSKEKAIEELIFFLRELEKTSPNIIRSRKICFAALNDTLEMIHNMGLDKRYNLSLQAQYPDIRKTTRETIAFFNCENHLEADRIVQLFHRESCPPKIELLDEIASDIVKNDVYMEEKLLDPPSYKARKSLPMRIAESKYPIIRTHFGIPSDTIEPTIEGIELIAKAGAVDEISLGSSDLSQRYFGDPGAFDGMKNDGGIPYKTKEDLIRLFEASRFGNFPSEKPYCHVSNIIEFIDVCLEVGMLEGAHQAVPLFWFSELDGRGPMSVENAIVEHIRAIKYLAKKGIPTEMNDPNQWSSRLAHDAVFVADYALIASIMYNAKSANMIFQYQFNKPMETGDFADLAKFEAATELIRRLKPSKQRHSIFIETRAGIDHFSVDQQYAKFQLARTTLLQMLVSPSIIHLVSFCEADHAATAYDVISSAKLLRRTMRLFRENEYDIRKAAKNDFVERRKQHLINEAYQIMLNIAKQSKDFVLKDNSNWNYLVPFLSDEKALQLAINKRIMTAPGIMNERFKNDDIITRAGLHGAIDSYPDWETLFPQSEEDRLKKYLSQNFI